MLHGSYLHRSGMMMDIFREITFNVTMPMYSVLESLRTLWYMRKQTKYMLLLMIRLFTHHIKITLDINFQCSDDAR